MEKTLYREFLESLALDASDEVMTIAHAEVLRYRLAGAITFLSSSSSSSEEERDEFIVVPSEPIFFPIHSKHPALDIYTNEGMGARISAHLKGQASYSVGTALVGRVEALARPTVFVMCEDPSVLDIASIRLGLPSYLGLDVSKGYNYRG